MAPLEREVKLAYPSIGDARAAVARLALPQRQARRLQDDTLFDTPDATLRARRCTIRVRRDGGTTTLTYKGPPAIDAMKVRAEHETLVADDEAVVAILAGLGLQPTFRYQKFREEFGGGPLVVAIDETPIGVFVELEGTEAHILEATDTLGLTSAAYITASYARLFHERRAACGLADHEHMVFPA